MKTREMWRTIHGGYYAISNHGNVKRLIPACGARVGHILKPYSFPNSSVQYVKLCKRGKCIQITITELMLNYFPYSKGA